MTGLAVAFNPARRATSRHVSGTKDEPMGFLILDGRTVRGMIDTDEVIEAVEEAFIAYARGEVAMPAKIYLDLPGGDLRAMPALVPELAGIKWVNSHPGNPPLGLPAVMATILINEPRTGRPLALLDGTWITRQRTAAAAAIATRALARSDARNVGMIGCGALAEPMLRAVGRVMKIERIYLCDIEPARAERLAGRLGDLDCEVGDHRAVAASADVLCTTTFSRRPVVRAEWVRPGTHVNAMGADAPGKQEIDPALLKTAAVFVDDWKQAAHSGELNRLLESGEIERRDVAGTLGEVLAGTIPGRRDERQVTVFDSTGLAIQDLAVARRVWLRARERGVGLSVELNDQPA